LADKSSFASGRTTRPTKRSAEKSSGPLQEGVVSRVSPSRVEVRLDGSTIHASIRALLKKGSTRASAHVVAVGDRVRVRAGEQGGAWIEEILPRRSEIARQDPGNPKHKLVQAANCDALAVVVCYGLPKLNLRGLDRMLVLGEAASLSCFIIRNKSDLAAEPADSAPPGRGDPLEVDDRLGGPVLHHRSLPGHWGDPLAVYARLGYPLISVSALTGAGMDECAGIFRDRVTLIAGASGVGKSSLLNRLVAGLDLRTSAVSAATGKGVHTTTRVDWIDLPGGGVILDSPGIRGIVPFGVTRERLASLFPEFRALSRCQFGNCLHRGEPGCQVREAVVDGRIDAGRHESYLRILEGIQPERP